MSDFQPQNAFTQLNNTKNIEEAVLPLYIFIVSQFNVFGRESPSFIVSRFNALGGESPSQRILPLSAYIISHFTGILFGFAGKVLVNENPMTLVIGSSQRIGTGPVFLCSNLARASLITYEKRS